MQLFLMRHGEAVPSQAWDGSDSTRPLSPIGLAKLEAVSKEMKRAGFFASCILTSPFLRTKQTAELLSKGLSLNAPVVCQELAVGARNEVLRRVVTDHAAQAPLLLVGHMPEIAIFGSRLTSEPSVMDKGLETGEIVAIETDSLEKWGGCRILWQRKTADWKKVTV